MPARRSAAARGLPWVWNNRRTPGPQPLPTTEPGQGVERRTQMATDIVLAHITDPGIRNVHATTPRAAAQQLLAWQSPVPVMGNLSRLLLVLCLLTGCAPVPPLPFTLPIPGGSGQASLLTLTEVNLAQRNYRVVRTNVV